MTAAAATVSTVTRAKAPTLQQPPPPAVMGEHGSEDELGIKLSAGDSNGDDAHGACCHPSSPCCNSAIVI